MIRISTTALLAATLLTMLGCAQSKGPAEGQAPAAAATARPSPTPEQHAAHRAEMIALGNQFKTATELYDHLKAQAKGGQQNIAWDKIPDWKGVYSRSKGGTAFDPDGPAQGEVPTGKFTPEYQAKLLKDVTDRKNGIEYDPLSQCVPPGHPRWLSMPFLREFIVTPEQTTMIAEAFNSVRRIYTDGRQHTPEDERYPTENGDSIGFWDGDKLVVHTNMLQAHMYERAQGYYSDQVETVEIWYREGDRDLVADVWVYDPPALVEPWFTKQVYTALSNPEEHRIRHWACEGTQNNDVIQTKEGGSTFRDLTFTDRDDSKGSR